MAAGDRIFYCRKVTKNVTPIVGATHGEFTISGAEHVDAGGADAPGPAEILPPAKRSITVRIFGIDFNAMMALLDSAAENIVFGTVGAAGANEKITVKSVALTRWLGPVTIRSPDGGGATQAYGIEGEAEWGASDTLALMIAAAADS